MPSTLAPFSLDWGQILLIVTILTSLTKRFIEAHLPAASTDPANKSLHDATLRGVSLLYNLVLVVLYNVRAHTFDPHQAPTYLMQAIVLLGGCHLVYKGVTFTVGGSDSSQGRAMLSGVRNDVKEVADAIAAGMADPTPITPLPLPLPTVTVTPLPSASTPITPLTFSSPDAPPTP